MSATGVPSEEQGGGGLAAGGRGTEGGDAGGGRRTRVPRRPAGVDQDRVGPGGEQRAQTGGLGGAAGGVAGDDHERASLGGEQGGRDRPVVALGHARPRGRGVVAAEGGGDAGRHGAGGDRVRAQQLDDDRTGHAG